MNERPANAPFLVFTCGNPSRGDDALGPAMFDMLDNYKRQTGKLENVDLLTDFQLQIEHALDLENRHAVLFIDAGVSCQAPFELTGLRAEQDQAYTTHAMSPASLLLVYRQISKRDPPPCFLLTIRAYRFGLGQSLSKAAHTNLQQAFTHVVEGGWLRAKAT